MATRSSTLAWGFPGDSDGKESACQNRIQVQSLDQEDSPGVGNGNPLQSSCLENSMDRGPWSTHQFIGSQRAGRGLATKQ